MERQVYSKTLSAGRISCSMLFLAMCLPACETSVTKNGTLQCGTTDPRCPVGEECVAATNTCWKIGSFDGGLGLDGAAASVDGSPSGEAGHPLDSAPVDSAAVDTPL